MFERISPKTLRIGLILVAVAYLLLPFDLIPDFIGFPGRIDDILATGLLWWFYRQQLRLHSAPESGSEGSGRSGGADTGSGAFAGTKGAREFDAYEVLGVARSASSDAIRAAYRARMQEYHPDKVAHLGEELQKLAHEKSQEIQRAYRELRR